MSWYFCERHARTAADHGRWCGADHPLSGRFIQHDPYSGCATLRQAVFPVGACWFFDGDAVRVANYRSTVFKGAVPQPLSIG